MATEAPVEAIERQEWLQPVEEKLQRAVSSAYESAGPAGRKLKNFMHGVWLGHPLHPVLTDIPVGSWTLAFILDLMEAAHTRGAGRGADTAIKIGLAGAAGAAVTGLTDWNETHGSARRVGLIHGLLNVTSVTFYAASLLARRKNQRVRGRALAYLGFAVANASAYLGGHLVFAKQIGVNHAAGEQVPEHWIAVLDETELREGELRRVMADSVKVLLVRRNGEIHAVAEVCSHMGGPLAEGELEGDVVQCPWHGSRFDLRDGSVVDGPATHRQPLFEARIRNGQIEVCGRPSRD